MNNAKKLSPADALATTACSIALDNNVDMFVCLTHIQAFLVKVVKL
jgi:hypothetical protein